MSNLTPVEKLVVAQALYKKVAGLVETKNPANLRGEVDAAFCTIYASTKEAGAPAKTFNLELMGEKVGTYTITATEPKPAQTFTQLKIVNDEELLRWAVEYGFMKVDWDKIQSNFEVTGEIPDGCAVVEITTDAVEGGEVKSTTLRVDENKVIDIIKPQLPDVGTLFLEGGE